MEFEKLAKIIAEVLNVDANEITLDTTFVDELGADSLDVFQIIMGIEEEFDIEIPNEAAESIATVGDAVEQIKTLEKQLDQAQSTNATYAEQIDTLKTEVQRLKTFEDNQVEFQKIKEQFYEEVVYAENGPGADEYRQYYEEMDPTTAEALYKQVIQTEAADKQMQEYANTFSNMQASEAAAILGNMTDNLDLAASILKNLDVSTRGAILGAMDSAIAARIVKIMDPNS